MKEKQQAEFKEKFKDSIKKAYPFPDNHEADAEHHFENLLFISGFLQALCGPKADAPIHYPRLDEKPNPKVANLEWFKSNDNESESKEGQKLSLPAVTEDKTLPYNPKT